MCKQFQAYEYVFGPNVPFSNFSWKYKVVLPIKRSEKSKRGWCYGQHLESQIHSNHIKPRTVYRNNKKTVKLVKLTEEIRTEKYVCVVKLKRRTTYKNQERL